MFQYQGLSDGMIRHIVCILCGKLGRLYSFFLILHLSVHTRYRQDEMSTNSICLIGLHLGDASL